MNVGIVGGGPAGLFFAYLLKRHDEMHRIRIVERDAETATYGWGVVFSDIALAFVRDAAPELYAAISDGQEVSTRCASSIVAWPSRYATTRSTGWRVSTCCACCVSTVRRSVSEIEFGRKSRTWASSTIAISWVAADGAASAIRTRYQQHFLPAIDVRPNRFAWYGTTALIDPLSLIFRESEHGLFIAHAYRYSRTHSTFLVECDPTTFDKAGLGG